MDEKKRPKWGLTYSVINSGARIIQDGEVVEESFEINEDETVMSLIDRVITLYTRSYKDFRQYDRVKLCFNINMEYD